MKAFSHATSSVCPISLKLRYIFGLHERPSTILIGARDPDLDDLSSIGACVLVRGCVLIRCVLIRCILICCVLIHCILLRCILA